MWVQVPPVSSGWPLIQYHHQDSCCNPPLLSFLNAAMMPAGASSAAKCRSVMYEGQLGGWCSDTLAMMGTKREA